MARRTRRRRVLVIVLVVLVALHRRRRGLGLHVPDSRQARRLQQHRRAVQVRIDRDRGAPGGPVRAVGRPARAFADLLPPGPGKGYERFGFLYEPGPRDADRDDVPGEADRARRPQLRALPRRHVPGHAELSAADGPGDAVQYLAALGLHPVPAESESRQALQRRHAACGDRAPLPRPAFILRPAVLALRRHSADEGRVPGSRPGLRVARQPPPVRARPRRHVQPAEATRGLRHGGRPHGRDRRLPVDLGTAHADRDVPALGRQQHQPARAEPLGRTSRRRYGRLDGHPPAQPDRGLAPRPSAACLSAGSHQRAARASRADVLRAAVRLVPRPRRRPRRRR